MICDTCTNYIFDEEENDYICNVDMDEDDLVRFYSSPKNECSFYRLDDEYAVVRHQAT